MNAYNIKKSHKTKRRWLIIGCLVVLLVAGGVLAYTRLHHSKQSFAGTAGVSAVNYKPPTKQEQQAANTQKTSDISQQKLNNTPTPANASATVVISDANYYSDDNDVEVRGYVSNVIEDGGTCTATLTNESLTVTQTSTAFQDATTTQCGAIDIPRAKFGATGTWNVNLQYTSPTASGQQTTTLNL